MSSNQSLESRRGGQIVSLQVYRGLAALAVLVYHVSLQFRLNVPELANENVFDRWARLGHLGVDFFFVLSGFIIFYVHGREIGCSRAAAEFIRKRAIRIWPLMCSIIAIKAAYVLATRPSDFSWVLLVNNLLLLPGPKLVGVSWTLTFEVFFYSLFLVAIIVGWKFVKIATPLLVMLVIVISIWGGDSVGDPLATVSSPYILQFLMGSYVAFFAQRKIFVRLRNRWVVLGLIGSMMAGALIHPMNASFREYTSSVDPLVGRLYWGIVFSVLIWVSCQQDDLFKRKGKAIRVFSFLGAASFATYLFHNELITLLIVLWRKGVGYENLPLWIPMATVGTGAFLATLVVHVLLEKPLLRAFRR